MDLNMVKCHMLKGAESNSSHQKQ